MEPINTDGKLTQHSDDSTTSPPPKKAKHKEVQQLQTTSTNDNQQSTNSKETTEQQPLDDGIFNFVLPSEEDCALNPEENLEPNSVGLKSSRTKGVWHKSLEEAHSAKVKERTLFGHIMCSEDTQKKILESDPFRILESEGVTDRRSVQSFSLM